MRGIGVGLWLVGCGVIAFAVFGFDTTVSGYVNLGLQHDQLMMVVVAGLMVLVGAVLHAISYIAPERTGKSLTRPEDNGRYITNAELELRRRGITPPADWSYRHKSDELEREHGALKASLAPPVTGGSE